jgi:Cys-tRNA(Pro)/Cys-tRNA(Cys) deacylase
VECGPAAKGAAAQASPRMARAETPRSRGPLRRIADARSTRARATATLAALSSRGTPAIAALERLGIDHRVHEYELPEAAGRARDARPAYGLDAVRALGLPAERVFKTLVANVDGRLVLAVLPVVAELDLKALAAAVGGRRAALADPAAAERATGYVVGGISPIGGRRRLPVVIDEAAFAQPVVNVSAGRRGLEVALAPADLARAAGASRAPIARPR